MALKGFYGKGWTWWILAKDDSIDDVIIVNASFRTRS